MNLREEILREHSKQQCNKIVTWIGTDTKRFNQLFYLFLNDEYRVSQRAAWALSYAAIAHPHLMRNNYDKLLINLKKTGLHNSIKRNSVRLLQAVNFPEKYDGVIMEICFNYLASPDETVAVKAFSLSVLHKLSKKYPEIINEVKIIIHDQLPHQTAAFKSRAKLFMK